jgi:hypothetical protein
VVGWPMADTVYGDDSGAPEKDRSEGTSAAALEADGEGKE